MRLTNTLFILGMIIFPTASFAIFCPTNFSQIDYGNSVEQVIQTCGKPDSQETKEIKSEGPQEWIYSVPQTVSTNTSYQAQGTLKTSFVFDASGKAINISVNGIGVGATAICGKNIQLGDTRDTIKAACGDPSFINQSNPATTQQPPSTKQTILIYNSNPPATLVFENDQLKERK
jgi:hypothetical protein